MGPLGFFLANLMMYGYGEAPPKFLKILNGICNSFQVGFRGTESMRPSKLLSRSSLTGAQ